MKSEIIYWDSDCFLGHLKLEIEKAEQCNYTLERAEKGEITIITSALTIAEVLWIKGKSRVPKEMAVTINKFFNSSFIRISNVDKTIAETAR